MKVAPASSAVASANLRAFSLFIATGTGSMWRCFDGPPAFELIAGYGSGIHHRRAAVRKCVIGAAVVTHCSFVPLSHTVEPRSIFVVILPYPPTIVRPFVADV